MAEDKGRSAFNTAICRRVRQERERKVWTQAQMAEALGVGVEAYRKYEVRSPLPAALLHRFSLISGRSIQYLVTGQDALNAGPGRRRSPPKTKSPIASPRKGVDLNRN